MCALYGTTVPTDQPARYCFTSCLDESLWSLPCMSLKQGGACPQDCDPAQFP